MNQQSFEKLFENVALTEQDVYDIKWQFTLKGNSPEDVIRYAVQQLLQNPDFPASMFAIRNRRTGEIVEKDFREDIDKDW
jgi:hypothetical protein